MKMVQISPDMSFSDVLELLGLTYGSPMSSGVFKATHIFEYQDNGGKVPAPAPPPPDASPRRRC